MKASKSVRLACLLMLLPVAQPATAEPADETPICTDRPAKANAVCSVPAGTVQLESNAIGWSPTEADGARIELLTAGSFFVKVGLTDRSDLQLGFTPCARVTIKQNGTRERLSGVGDVLVRYKHRLTSKGANVEAGVIPFVKLPTASKGLGNDDVEGGLAVPISFALPGALMMTLGPELDLLVDGDGHGYHPALVNVVNLSMPIAPRLTLAGELWSNFNFDQAGTIRQASADAAVAYALSRHAQLDTGANFGLTRETPNLELYAGVSMRF